MSSYHLLSISLDSPFRKFEQYVNTYKEGISKDKNYIYQVTNSLVRNNKVKCFIHFVETFNVDLIANYNHYEIMVSRHRDKLIDYTLKTFPNILFDKNTRDLNDGLFRWSYCNKPKKVIKMGYETTVNTMKVAYQHRNLESVKLILEAKHFDPREAYRLLDHWDDQYDKRGQDNECKRLIRKYALTDVLKSI